MRSNDPYGIIELGNISLKCIIFTVDENNNSKILSTSISKSEGIYNGTIVNLTKASSSIRSCISAAEKEAKVSLKKISIVIEQPEFLCTKFSKKRKINGAKIHKDDIEFLLKEAKKEAQVNDAKHSIIHIFNHNYIVDGKIFIEEPIDIFADYLSHEMTFVTMPKNNIKNIKQAFIDCDIEVERIISCVFALAANLLKNYELQHGSILIDIGYEKISLGLFKNLALVHSITLPLGINHITKDISKVCSLSLKESENIKNNIDFSFEENIELFDEKKYLKEIYFVESKYRKISSSLVENIAKARIDEILEIVKKQITITGLSTISGTNIFIVGGGSKLLKLEKYCSSFFGFNVNKLSDYEKKQNKIIYQDDFSSCFGALKIIKDGWETEAIPQPSSEQNKKLNFFSKIFRLKL